MSNEALTASIPFEWREEMLHLRPTTIFGNIIQDTHRKIAGLSITMQSVETGIIVDPRLNINILAEASNLFGRVQLTIEAPPDTDAASFQAAISDLHEELASFADMNWESLATFIRTKL